MIQLKNCNFLITEKKRTYKEKKEKHTLKIYFYFLTISYYITIAF